MLRRHLSSRTFSRPATGATSSGRNRGQMTGHLLPHLCSDFLRSPVQQLTVPGFPSRLTYRRLRNSSSTILWSARRCRSSAGSSPSSSCGQHRSRSERLMAVLVVGAAELRAAVGEDAQQRTCCSQNDSTRSLSRSAFERRESHPRTGFTTSEVNVRSVVREVEQYRHMTRSRAHSIVVKTARGSGRRWRAYAPSSPAPAGCRRPCWWGATAHLAGDHRGGMACSARQLAASIDGSHKKKEYRRNSLARLLGATLGVRLRTPIAWKKYWMIEPDNSEQAP